MYQHSFVRHQRCAGHYIWQVKDRNSKCCEAKSLLRSILYNNVLVGTEQTYRDQSTSSFAYKNKSRVSQPTGRVTSKNPGLLSEGNETGPEGCLSQALASLALSLPPCFLHFLVSTLLQFVTNSNLCPSIYVGLRIYIHGRLTQTLSAISVTRHEIGQCPREEEG